MRLLVVEDEIKTGDYLQQGLTESGFLVTLVRNGLDGHHLAMTETLICWCWMSCCRTSTAGALCSHYARLDVRHPYCS